MKLLTSILTFFAVFLATSSYATGAMPLSATVYMAEAETCAPDAEAECKTDYWQFCAKKLVQMHLQGTDYENFDYAHVSKRYGENAYHTFKLYYSGDDQTADKLATLYAYITYKSKGSGYSCKLSIARHFKDTDVMTVNFTGEASETIANGTRTRPSSSGYEPNWQAIQGMRSMK